MNEIADLLDKEAKKNEKIGGVGEESRKQMMFRLNKTAKHLIENVGKGSFPQHNVRG